MMLTKSLSQASFANAIEHIKMKGKEKLFSYTFNIHEYDPLRFFRVNEQFGGERFFWKSSEDSHWMVGLGIASKLSSHSPAHRFTDVHTQWNTLIAQANIQNPYKAPGTGPLLFGGFAFDPASMKETEWESFGHSLFYLPKYMLTAAEGQYYLTINLMCGAHRDISIVEEAEQFIEELQSNRDGGSSKRAVMTTSMEIAPDEWVQVVGEIVKELQETDLKKVVMARKMKLTFTESISTAYVLEKLTKEQPTSFVFAIEAKESCFLGATPERLIKKTGNLVYSAGLAGSTGRSDDNEEDLKLGAELLKDEKNRFEHELVVSMIKEALLPYCEEIIVPEEPVLMKIRDIQHLYTPVTGVTKPEGSLFKIVEELHPTPALGGVPTKPAMEVIREREQMDRGFYAAPIGWTDYRSNGEFVVAIRSGLLQGNEAILYAGCGLVADSVPEDELVETRIKFRPMLRATGGEVI